MSAPVRIPLRQGTPAWLDARRTMITSTDIPVLLGLSPYKCEADLADEKLLGVEQESSLPMRVGTALQDLIGEEYSRATGRKVRSAHGMFAHPDLAWAACSPDFTVVGEKRLVEAKSSGSRARFADGIPQDVEAQVAWALGVSGYPVADIAVLVGNRDFMVVEQAADPALFTNLVAIAENFRARLAAGGPFARDADRIKRDHPTDDGTEMVADADVDDAVRSLLGARAQRVALEKAEEALEAAIKTRMGDAARLVGEGYSVTWKRTRDVTTTDWKSVADGLLRQLPETERTALVGLSTSVRPGFRPFRVVLSKEATE